MHSSVLVGAGGVALVTGTAVTTPTRVICAFRFTGRDKHGNQEKKKSGRFHGHGFGWFNETTYGTATSLKRWASSFSACKAAGPAMARP